MSGPASPYAMTNRQRSASSGARLVYGSPLCRPPSNSTKGRCMAMTATVVAAMFVAFESLIHSIPPTSRTGSSRCGSARNERSPAPSNGAGTPASCTANAAASALATLWSPRRCSSSRVISDSPPSRSSRFVASYEASAGLASENSTLRPATPRARSSTSGSSALSTHTLSARALRNSRRLSA